MGKDSIVMRNMNTLSYYPLLKLKDIKGYTYSGRLYIKFKKKYPFSRKVSIKLSAEEYRKFEEMINNYEAGIHISDEK